MRRRAVRAAVAVVVGLTVVLAACGGSSSLDRAPSAAESAADSAVRASPTSAAPAGTARTVEGAGGGVGGSAAVRRCAAGDLDVAFGPTSVAEGGQRQRPIILTNHTAGGCAMTGFPGVELVAGNGSHYFDLVRSSIVRPERIVLAPGGTARATMRYLPVRPGDAGAYDVVRVLVTPPDTTTPTSLPWDGGPVLDQSGATHPGTYILALTAD
ncbi:DUF4232 domain-containing protein [Frankia sp. AgKG'84/4]|uniref:DUF4232 domain-containing protein n=1 Tax=Frankia sp. AgKG'84/4 TaxID=573490 RepID=UPI00200BF950|nr:DUF4232 domain-containing protein [Frankia sp. AgKG'84/4]MCL9794167.1 DUF4232 domain-containing protein [Frankia sp. AgKG'84/4]